MRPMSSDGRRLVLGAGILVGFSALFVMFLLGTIPNLLSGTTAKVRANFASTDALNVGEPVRVDGLTVGKVTGVDADDAQGSTVTMDLKGDYGTLYANARATIRWRTVLGGAYAVEIDRGTPGLPPLGAHVIPASRTADQVEVDEVVATLRKDQRTGLKTMVHEIPKALADGDQPTGILKALEQNGHDIAAGLDSLRGVDRDRDLGRLVRNGGAAMRALNAPQRTLQSLVQNAAITTGVTARRAGDVTKLLDELAVVQPSIRAAMSEVQSSLHRVNPLVRTLMTPAGDVAPTLRQLRPVVEQASTLLQKQAKPLLVSLRPTASSLSTTATQGVPLLDELRPTLDQLKDHVLHDLDKVSPESQHTAIQMVGPAIAGLEGAASHFDQHGPIVRLLGTLGGHAYDGLPCQLNFTDPASSAFLHCQSLSRTLGALFPGVGITKENGK